jgi:hypothetical protein
MTADLLLALDALARTGRSVAIQHNARQLAAELCEPIEFGPTIPELWLLADVAVQADVVEILGLNWFDVRSLGMDEALDEVTLVWMDATKAQAAAVRSALDTEEGV